MKNGREIRRVLSGGRVTIDEQQRKALGLKDGDYVLTRIHDGVLEILPAKVTPR